MVEGKIAFIGGAHIDRMGKLTGQVIEGASNPGIVKTVPGGAGLNTASVAAALGVDGLMICPIGDDESGVMLRQVLADRGVGDCLIAMPGRETGSYVSILGPDGNLVIALADLGLNEEITFDWLMGNYGLELKTSRSWFLTTNLPRGVIGELVRNATAEIIATSPTPMSTRDAIV